AACVTNSGVGVDRLTTGGSTHEDFLFYCLDIPYVWSKAPKEHSKGMMDVIGWDFVYNSYGVIEVKAAVKQKYINATEADIQHFCNRISRFAVVVYKEHKTVFDWILVSSFALPQFVPRLYQKCFIIRFLSSSNEYDRYYCCAYLINATEEDDWNYYCVFRSSHLLAVESASARPFIMPKCERGAKKHTKLTEYQGVANIVAENAWLRNLLCELHSLLSTATLVYYDNVSVVYMSANPVQHQRTKHIEINIHFVQIWLPLVRSAEFIVYKLKKMGKTSQDDITALKDKTDIQKLERLTFLGIHLGLSSFTANVQHMNMKCLDFMLRSLLFLHPLAAVFTAEIRPFG
nr:NBS-containing resistance-like protein [Tanacetum cinerariifolium]